MKRPNLFTKFLGRLRMNFAIGRLFRSPIFGPGNLFSDIFQSFLRRGLLDITLLVAMTSQSHCQERPGLRSHQRAPVGNTKEKDFLEVNLNTPASALANKP